MNILIIASEAAPLATAGGLGDVMGSLPIALTELGCKVSVALPAYRPALRRIKEWEVAAVGLPVILGKRRLTGDILLGQLDRNVPIYCLLCLSLSKYLFRFRVLDSSEVLKKLI